LPVVEGFAFCGSAGAAASERYGSHFIVFPAYSIEAKRPLEGGPDVSAEPGGEEKRVIVDHAAYREPYRLRRMIWFVSCL